MIATDEVEAVYSNLWGATSVLGGVATRDTSGLNLSQGQNNSKKLLTYASAYDIIYTQLRKKEKNS